MILELAARCEDIHRRIESIAANDSLSIDTKTSVMALLLSVNADLFPKLAAALRTTTPESQSL
jgi:hypothetical protein